MSESGRSSSARDVLAQSMREINPHSIAFTSHESTSVRDVLAEAKHGDRQKRGTLKNIEVEFVRSRERGRDFDERHNARLITRQAIEVLLKGDPEEIENFRKTVGSSGGFFLYYDGVGAERIDNAYDIRNTAKGGWLMGEASAIPTTDDAVALPQRVVGADVQVYIPPDRAVVLSDELAPLPLAPKDRPIEGDAIVREIAENSQIAMLIADISSVFEWQKFGFAAAAEDGAFKRVVTEINATRTHVVKYALAAIASLKGIQNRNHENLTEMFDPGFRNLRSLLLHTARVDSAPGVILGKQTSRTIPVELPAGDSGYIVLDWWIAAQPLAGMKVRNDITIHEEDISQ